MLFLLSLYGGFAGAGAVYYIVTEFARDLPPDLSIALDAKRNRATRVYSADGQLIGEFFLEKRVPVPPERIPDHVRQAFISAEDRRFWDHPGFDLMGIARAAYTNFQSGATRQGASTITQQLTRMFFLSNERTYSRKIKELILSVRVEGELDKGEILHLYLDHVYLGSGAYGAQAAAEIYFGKDVDQLTVAEAAMLAGLVQAPTHYSPHNDFGAARARQMYVLDRMLEDGYITGGQHDAAIAEPLAILERDRPLNHLAAPYFVEHIRRWAQTRFGYRDVYRGGLRIYTTLDTRMQRAAEAAVRDGLVDLDRKIGFRGPLGHLDDEALAAWSEGQLRPYLKGLEALALTSGERMLADVTYVGAVATLPPRGGAIIELGPETLPLDDDDARRLRAWRGEREGRAPAPRIQVGDLLPVTLGEDDKGNPQVELAQAPDVEAAMVALDPHTGRVLAMVGGYDYLQSQFNRVTQARRQIGSAMKPFIYATAMGHGSTHLDTLIDAPVAVPTAAGIWAPSNYDNEYIGPVTLRTALAKSLNTISVRLVLNVGVGALIETMRALGIESPIPRHISIALGTPDLTLLEVAAGYGGIANGGKRVTPRFVDLVTTDDGRVVEDNRGEHPRVQAISPELAYLTTDLMQVVVARGTGRRAQALGRPVAGKTGTSTGHRDAWFLGFTADLLAGVWVGRDDFTPIGARATGGGAALPIWLQFMEAAHPDTPPRAFPVPDDIRFVRADELSGGLKPAGSRSAAWVPFARGTVPPRFLHNVEYATFRDGDGFPLPGERRARPRRLRAPPP